MRLYFSFAGFCLVTIPFFIWTVQYLDEADWSSKHPLVIFPWEWVLYFGKDMAEPVPHFIFHLTFSLIGWHQVILAERGRKFTWNNVMGCFIGQAFILPLTTYRISANDKLAITDDKKKVGSSIAVHIYQLHTVLAIQAIPFLEGTYFIICVTMYALLAPIIFGFAVGEKSITLPGLYKFLWGITSFCTLSISLWQAIIWANWSAILFVEAGMKNWASFCLMFDSIILFMFGVYTLAFESEDSKMKPVLKEA